MNRITSFALSIAVGLTLAQPISAFADNNDKKEKQGPKVGSQPPHVQKAEHQARVSSPQKQQKQFVAHTNQAHVQQQTHQVAANSGSHSKKSVDVQRNAEVQRNVASQQNVKIQHNGNRQNNVAVQQKNQQFSRQQVNTGGGNYTSAKSVTRINHSTTTINNQQFASYNQSNNYGGRWFPADTYSSWNRNRDYYYNDHRYSWYNGGWLIVDGGYWPTVATYSPGYYSGGGNVAVSVQSSLANQGYYNGPIDGAVGPGTRGAIASYQRDNGLTPTGRINPPLLASLGLQ